MGIVVFTDQMILNLLSTRLHDCLFVLESFDSVSSRFEDAVHGCDVDGNRDRRNHNQKSLRLHNSD